MEDIRQRMFGIEDKIDQVLNHHGHYMGHHHTSEIPAEMEDELSPFNPMNQFMGGGHAMPVGVMNPGMINYGMPYGMPGVGGMPMGAYNMPDNQDDGGTPSDERKLKAHLKV